MLPLARMVVPALQSAAPASFAVVLRLAAGAVALLGSYHAVSAATAIVSPYTVNGTAGARYIRQLGTSVRTALSWSANTAPLHSPTYPLTPGLYLTNLTGRIGGIPTWSGVSNITISAWENSDNSGGQVSSVFTFTIAAGSGPPVVAQPPGDVSAVRGTLATLYVGAYGSEPLTYQWQFEGVDVPGATNATLSMSSVQTNRAGNYTVTVNNALGTAQSAGSLTVLYPPAFVTPLTPLSVDPGTGVLLAPAFVGSAPLTYRWQFNGANIYGGTNFTYSIPSAQSANAGNYRLIITNPYGTVSTTAALTVNGPPAIIVPPANRAVSSGVSAVFSVTAGGQAPLSFQWLKDGEPLPGKTDPSLTVTNAGLADVGRYSVAVSNALGVTTSPDAFLRLSFGVVPSSSALYRLTNVWRYDQRGLNLPNSWRDVDYDDTTWPAGPGILAVEDSANPTVFNNLKTTLSLRNGGQFVTNFYFRTHFTLTNRAQLSSLTFSNILDDGAVFYLNGSEIFRVNMPAGTVNATTLAASTSTEGVYTVNVASASAAVEGDNVVAVEVHQVNDTSSDIVMGSALFATYATPNTAPLILIQPVGAAVEAGTPVTLTSAAEGTGALTYRWLKDGVAVAGASAASLSLPGVQQTDVGGYAFVASNTYGSVTSRVANVTIQIQNVSPVLAIQLMEANTYQLHLTGRAGRSYALQASANLVDWETLGVVTADAAGAALFTDTDPGARPGRFYRAVEQ